MCIVGDIVYKSNKEKTVLENNVAENNVIMLFAHIKILNCKKKNLG